HYHSAIKLLLHPCVNIQPQMRVKSRIGMSSNGRIMRSLAPDSVLSRRLLYNQKVVSVMQTWDCGMISKLPRSKHYWPKLNLYRQCHLLSSLHMPDVKPLQINHGPVEASLNRMRHMAGKLFLPVIFLFRQTNILLKR